MYRVVYTLDHILYLSVDFCLFYLAYKMFDSVNRFMNLLKFSEVVSEFLWKTHG